jgi:hypothetical protein
MQATAAPQVIPFENSPEALARDARQLIAGFGYTAPPLDRDYRFALDSDFLRFGRQTEKPQDFRAQQAAGQPAIMFFWYRQSPRYLEPVNPWSIVTRSDPPTEVSGMVNLYLDPQGRLLYFHAVPPEVETPAASPSTETSPTDWNRFFAAAGLDPARFTPAEPQWVPLVGFDRRAAWTGSFPQTPSLTLRVEAASWRGRPVDFRLVGPWTRPDRTQSYELSTGQLINRWTFILVPSLVFVIAILFAWRNVRLRRGDTRGAFRVSGFLVCCGLLNWVTSAHHVPTQNEYVGLTWGLSVGLFSAAVFWVIYVAAEPYIRRRWPQSLISWTRLVAGGFRDPLVGAHTLLGVAVGIAVTLVTALPYLWMRSSGAISSFAENEALLDVRRGIDLVLFFLPKCIYVSLIMLFVFFLLRALLRREWIAGVVIVAALTVIGAAGSSERTPAMLSGLAVYGIATWVLVRFGVLPMSILVFVLTVLQAFPMTTDFSAWYSGISLAIVVFILAIAAFGFYTALGGRKLFHDGFLES